MLVLEKDYDMITRNKVHYVNPNSTNEFCQWLVGFVDDNSILFKLENLGYDYPVEIMVISAKEC